MKHPMRRRFMYWGFLGLQAVARLLPVGAAQACGRWLGRVAWLLLRREAARTEQHLAYAFGEALSAPQRRRIARQVFVNLGQTAMEWLLLPRLSPQAIQRLVTAEGIEHLRQAIAKGTGAIVVTAHFGNWELIALYLRSLGFECAVLARRLRYPEYESFFIGLRGARGVPTLARGSVKEVAQLLRANRLVGLLPDQDVESLEGVFVDFLGHPAHTSVGPAALSLMTGAPIIPCVMRREGSQFRLLVEPPVGIARSGDRRRDLAALTQTWSDVLASHIRRCPQQWVWMHRRWKTQPPAEAAAVGSGLRVQGNDPEPHLSGGSAQPGLAVLLVACCLLLNAGCGKPAQRAAEPADSAEQQMSTFNLTGYEPDGSKRWDLEGRSAQLDGQQVTILRPHATGYEAQRTSHLTATAAVVQQSNRRVRLEHDVTIHTSDGVWFTTPALYWSPDLNQFSGDSPARIETDHMLVRGRGVEGSTQLKHARLLSDVEVVLNPSDDEPAVPGGRRQVIITCDGPLALDYERNIAVFEQNVHIADPNGDVYSDKLTAYFNQGTRTIRYAEAEGRVRIHQHQHVAESERAIYEPALGKITLVGRPSLLLYPEESGGQTPSFSDLAIVAPQRRN
ncbi:MAG: LPS export ABC transporter periplasmic protein LptC [Candidatus Omnitrophica bacterium]|nr:LPS export ABC transporter periplasmic protein LptC [Candidatus Omnitrophota bacterium]